jgi:hypothetical protein
VVAAPSQTDCGDWRWIVVLPFLNSALKLVRVSWKLRWRSPARNLRCLGVWPSARNSESPGTAVKEGSQVQPVDASVSMIHQSGSGVAPSEVAENYAEHHCHCW